MKSIFLLIAYPWYFYKKLKQLYGLVYDADADETLKITPNSEKTNLINNLD